MRVHLKTVYILEHTEKIKEEKLMIDMYGCTDARRIFIEIS